MREKTATTVGILLISVMVFGGWTNTSPTCNPFWETHQDLFPFGDDQSGVTTDFDAGVYLGNYPNAKETSWIDHPQGLTHDDANWYFTRTQLNTIIRVPATSDINTKSLPVGAFQKKLAQMNCGIPTDYNHFGDLDSDLGVVWIPVEYKNKTQDPIVVIVDPNTLNCISWVKIPDFSVNMESGAPWVAIQPVGEHLVFTSNYDMSEAGGYLRVYERVVNGEGELNFLGFFELYDTDGSLIELEGVQGGAFSPRGHLYLLVMDFDNKALGSGVYVFDMISGVLAGYMYAEIQDKHEHFEGITVWDLNDPLAPAIPGPPDTGGWMQGQVHAGLNRSLPAFKIHKWYLKHFSVDPAGM